MTAPAIGGASIALAVALVWYFRPQPEPSLVLDDSAVTAPAAPPVALPDPARNAAPPAPLAPRSTTEPVASTAPAPQRSPLPGEAPATPMTQLLADRELNVIVGRAAGADSAIPPQLAEGERSFAAEPIDTAWAPGAEARLLAVFAEMPGLKLIDLQAECRSTMCRLQLMQPPAAPGQQPGALPFNILRDEVGMTPRWMMAVVDGFPADRTSGPLPIRSIAYLWREGFAPENSAAADEGR
jgi:hypothetical protein